MMMMNWSILAYFYLLFIFSTRSQQFQWTLLSEGQMSGDGPTPRRDAAMGFDNSFLILFGGRDQSGMPNQDTFAFNILQGYWERLNFPNAPPPRYGMAAASAPGSGLYMFGGFGIQGTSQNYNPYTAYGSSGLPGYRKNPAGKTKRAAGVSPRQNYNPMNQNGYNGNNYRYNDDRIDENYYPMQDSWFLNYMTKSWQETQRSQYGRGLGSAAASPYSSGIPRVIYSMGKSRDWMYSTIETSSQMLSGFNQFTGGQAATIMYDLSSYSPAYPHARYGHSTALLTDNHLLLYGGCLSGYGKGGPCPSSDTWLLHIDRGHWERLWECPTTKTGAAMVTLPSYSTCSAMGGRQGVYGGGVGMAMGNEQPVAVLWGGREFNPSSIRSYISPQDEVAVFNLNQKEWMLKRARPSENGYPRPREGASYVAGCFQNTPGMFVFGGRSVADGQMLSDLWFLQASPQDALNAPRSRGCIYPFSYYHLHGIFQFFAYGLIFPVGYLIGGHADMLPKKRQIHLFCQLFGLILAIIGFSLGVHSVRTPSWLHFRHPHAIIGIITFILTIVQFVAGLAGIFFLRKRTGKTERVTEPGTKVIRDVYVEEKSGVESIWRTAHHILGGLILALGFVNISLGVFLAVLPLAVWICWFIWMGFFVLIIIGMEVVSLIRRGGKGKSHRLNGQGGGKGTSRPSSQYVADPTQHTTRIIPPPRRGQTRVPLNESSARDISSHRRADGGDDMAPLITNHRHPRTGDVSASAGLPDYSRPNEREYPIAPRKKSGPSESAGFDYYVGYAPEHEQPLPRSAVQQQNEHNFSRVRLS